MERKYLIEINVIAAKHGLPPWLVWAVCRQESAFDRCACRYEDRYRWLFDPSKVKPRICSLATEEIFQKTSWGLMQVMGAIYREYGYKGWLSAIPEDVESQLEYGCMHLAGKIKKYGLEGGIVSYNAGSPRKGDDGKYVNQHYLDSVLSHKEYFHAHIDK